MASERDPFWMVYGEGQRAPTVRHMNQRDAEDEAKRLASACPGVRFVVLQSVIGFRRPESIETTVYPSLPF